jgi:glycosyltransferase involved in cell wall biosynthesis
MVERVVLMWADRGEAVDGIRDYTTVLAEKLRQEPVEVDHSSARDRALGGGDARDIGRVVRSVSREGPRSVVLFQYMPFAYAKWGFAPMLPASLLALRARRDRPLLAVMVHEPYVPMDSWQWMLMGAWQRSQLAAIRSTVDVVFTSIEPWAEAMRRQPPWRAAHHLPVGSNLPDRRSRRESERRRIGATDETVVVASMGRDHPSWLSGHVVEAANAVGSIGKPTILLSLGAEAPLLSGLDPSIRVEAPGFLDAEALSGMLSAADIFLAPLAEGVSTRRTTLMTAMQHGLPVVGTSGPLTDSILLRSGAALRLIPLGRPDLFAEEAAKLAARPAEREALGRATRSLYEQNFDWPVVTRKLLDSLSA